LPVGRERYAKPPIGGHRESKKFGSASKTRRISTERRWGVSACCRQKRNESWAEKNRVGGAQLSKNSRKTRRFT